MSARYRLPAGAGEVMLTVASASHVGRVRLVNEDSLLVEPPVFAVADGMGGHAFGDLASAAAVQALREELSSAAPSEPNRVLAAIRAANTAVRELTMRTGTGAGAETGDHRVIAGTTLTGVALVVEHPDADTDTHSADALPRWMVFNLGDSRVYRWDASRETPAGGRLERVSVDHSIVQELFDAGVIDEARTRTHPDRNIITRALGASDEVKPEAWLLPASHPQTFLICSDGLTKELDDARIAAVLASTSDQASDQDSAVELLLAAALEAGGHDNITIVLVRSEYHRAAIDGVDEQTRDRALSPELEETLPRL